MLQIKDQDTKLKLIPLAGVLVFTIFMAAQFIYPIFKNNVLFPSKTIKTQEVNKESAPQTQALTAATITEEEINSFLTKNEASSTENAIFIKIYNEYVAIKVSEDSKNVDINLVVTEDKKSLKMSTYNFLGFDEYNEDAKKQLVDLLTNGINEYIASKNSKNKIKELTLTEGKINIVYEL